MRTFISTRSARILCWGTSEQSITSQIIKLHTDPQRHCASAAAVGLRAAASAWFLLWFPSCAGPAESKSRQGEGFNSHRGYPKTKDNWIPCAFDKLGDTNIPMSPIMCCWDRRVGHQLNPVPDPQCTSTSCIWSSHFFVLFSSSTPKSCSEYKTVSPWLLRKMSGNGNGFGKQWYIDREIS